MQRLHALYITTGAEKFGGPIVIQASVHGSGDGASASTVPFGPKSAISDAAELLCQNGLLSVVPDDIAGECL